MRTIFNTHTEFDINSITTFGLSAKPNSSNPIGYFGTGLKYAIAVLVRNNIKVEILFEGKSYKLYTKKKNYRGKDVSICRMVRNDISTLGKIIPNKSKYYDLPFTTKLGQNWELWMAFRELYANTLDENGYMILDSDHDYNNYARTTIIVEGQDFYQIAESEKDIIFLPKDKEPIIKSPTVEVYAGASKYLYYRGMRAYDLPDDRQSIFTYNYTGSSVYVSLTEDRTIDSTFFLKEFIMKAFAYYTDKESCIKTLLDAPAKSFEYGLAFDEYADKMSESFYNQLRKSGHSSNIKIQSLASSALEKDLWADAKVTPTIWSTLMEVLSIELNAEEAKRVMEALKKEWKIPDDGDMTF